jgi:hypothetical protein
MIFKSDMRGAEIFGTLVTRLHVNRYVTIFAQVRRHDSGKELNV